MFSNTHLLAAAADMLDTMSNHFSSHTCNDYEWPSNWTGDQKRAFLREVYRYNSGITEEGGPEVEDLLEDLRALRCPSDFTFAATLAS